MPLTRTFEDPLLSEDPTLRKVALLQLSGLPTEHSAREALRALRYFLKDAPAIAAEFLGVLSRPPLSKICEEPLREWLAEPDAALRERAAYLLYVNRLHEGSRAAVSLALQKDRSPWVRGLAAKALALLGGDVAGLLGEALDDEADLEAVGRMAEAAALTGTHALAPILAEQAEALRERHAPALPLALFVEALASVVDPKAVDGQRQATAPGFTYTCARGTVRLGGGKAAGGFAARVQLHGHPEVVFEQDTPAALPA
jgi:hypothetical protein